MDADRQRIAVVSGANRGIGEEVARQLREDHGYVVYAGARTPSGDQVQLDVTDEDSIDALRARIEDERGYLDALVNNAGIAGPYESIAESDLAEAQRVLDTNLFGAWRLSQAMMPLLHKSEAPRIVNLSSGMGQLSDMNGGAAPYRVSKTGINALTRILSEEEGRNGVLVNSACPGWVRTDMGGRGARLPVEKGADTPVWLATLPDDGPTGGFFRERKPIPW